MTKREFMEQYLLIARAYGVSSDNILKATVDRASEIWDKMNAHCVKVEPKVGSYTITTKSVDQYQKPTNWSDYT